MAKGDARGSVGRLPLLSIMGRGIRCVNARAELTNTSWPPSAAAREP